jgi:ABC-type enterochelin transport system ATPase subunit
MALSFEDNISIGGGGFSKSNIEPVRQAAEQVGIHPKIRSFKSYYASQLSRSSRATSTHSDQIWVPGQGWITEHVDLPFLVKVLRGNPHLHAKHGEKYLGFEPRPYSWTTSAGRDEKEIPEEDPGMQAVGERVHSGNLSGGQLQKVAMARAFMKIREADLVILDEPTSALDPQAEYELFKTLMEVRKNRTTIFIVPTPPRLPLILIESSADGLNSLIDFIPFVQRTRSSYMPSFGWVVNMV